MRTLEKGLEHHSFDAHSSSGLYNLGYVHLHFLVGGMLHLVVTISNVCRNIFILAPSRSHRLFRKRRLTLKQTQDTAACRVWCMTFL